MQKVNVTSISPAKNNIIQCMIVIGPVEGCSNTRCLLPSRGKVTKNSGYGHSRRRRGCGGRLISFDVMEQEVGAAGADFLDNLTAPFVGESDFRAYGYEVGDAGMSCAIDRGGVFAVVTGSA